MQNDFLEIYDQVYAPLLAQRADGFRTIFEMLEKRRLSRGPDYKPWIIETGSLRLLNNWAGDGQSTRLFDIYAAHTGGNVITIDIDPEAQQVVVANCSKQVMSIASDSVAALHKLASEANGRTVDLLYLDSFDIDFNNVFPSAFHHVKELVSAMPLLDDGTIVGVDDNFVLADGSRVGKGMLVRAWFNDIGQAPIHDGYQYIWEYRRS
jgi:hypothetical protein